MSRLVKLVAIAALIGMTNLAILIGLDRLTSTRPSASGSSVSTIGGDVNGDGSIDVADPIYLISYLFEGGPEPVAVACPEAANDSTILWPPAPERRVAIDVSLVGLPAGVVVDLYTVPSDSRFVLTKWEVGGWLTRDGVEIGSATAGPFEQVGVVFEPGSVLGTAYLGSAPAARAFGYLVPLDEPDHGSRFPFHPDRMVEFELEAAVPFLSLTVPPGAYFVLTGVTSGANAPVDEGAGPFPQDVNQGRLMDPGRSYAPGQTIELTVSPSSSPDRLLILGYFVPTL